MEVTDSRAWFVRVVRGGARGLLPRLVRGVLSPAGRVYGVAVLVRRWMYRVGIARVRRAGVPVISVGNVTVGGTGKTPMVAWLARWLQAKGRRPAVLSRGYGAGAGCAKNDEALLLERWLADVPHYRNPDRVAGGRAAVAAGADCLVLDDGFQHVRLARDVDVVLIDATDPFGNGRVLPRGILREPVSVLRDADVLVLTRVDAVAGPRLDALRARMRALAPGIPVVEAVHRARGLVGTEGDEVEKIESLRGKKVCAFCGIGNPEGFLATVRGLGAEVVGVRFLPDHFVYDERAAVTLAEWCAAAGADTALTTEKDLVKVGRFWSGGVRLRALSVEIEFTAGLENFEEVVRSALG